MSATLEKPKPGLALAVALPLAIWFVLSAVATGLLVTSIVRSEDVFDELARIPAGEATEVELTRTGGYRIWLERPGVTEELSVGATATVTGPDGEDVPVETYDGELEFEDAVAVLTFNADETGTYTIEATEDAFGGSGSASGSGTEFAIGKGNPFSEVGKGFALFFGIGGLGFVIALILLIVFLVKRGRSKRRITQASFAGGGYGSGGGYPPPGGYAPPGGFAPPGGDVPPGGGPPWGGDPPSGGSWSA